MEILDTIKSRNEALYFFGALNLIFALILILLSRFSSIEVAGTNAWHKPIKFALSTGILSWSMAWYTHYLDSGWDIKLYNWILILTLGFEVIYIAIQAGRGQMSHFNQSSAFTSGMFTLMAGAATIATLATAYIGIKFFTREFPELPDYYLWAIRLGMILFVIFSFEGFLMGSQMAHTIGGPDGGPGLPFLNWSRKFGDARVAHFIGMHALQLLPILSFYVLRNVKLTLIGAVLYASLAVYVLVQALQGKPFLKMLFN